MNKKFIALTLLFAGLSSLSAGNITYRSPEPSQQDPVLGDVALVEDDLTATEDAPIAMMPEDTPQEIEAAEILQNSQETPVQQELHKKRLAAEKKALENAEIAEELQEVTAAVEHPEVLAQEEQPTTSEQENTNALENEELQEILAELDAQEKEPIEISTDTPGASITDEALNVI